MYKTESVLYNVSVTYEAGGLWKVGDEGTREGRRQRGNRSGVKSEDGMESQGVGDGGGGEGGKVWKLADRTGYAQTGSQAQAQT